jgi:hypothetical protein
MNYFRKINSDYILSLKLLYQEKKFSYTSAIVFRIWDQGNANEDVQTMIQTLGKRVAFPETHGINNR